MKKEITKNLMVVVMRSGIEIWIERDKIEKFISILNTADTSKFINIGDEVVNTADITGIFSPKTMESVVNKKNGRWLCKYNVWHERGEKCGCYELERYNLNKN